MYIHTYIYIYVRNTAGRLHLCDFGASVASCGGLASLLYNYYYYYYLTAITIITIYMYIYIYIIISVIITITITITIMIILLGQRRKLWGPRFGNNGS